MISVRLAVYSDDPYRAAGDGVHADMAFALFPAAMRSQVTDLIILGRLAPADAELGPRLPADVRFVPLPWWDDLSRPLQVLRVLRATVTRYWRALDDVDGVWLLGPSPLSLMFAAITAIRRRRLALGVRMDYPQYVRHRHPGRTLLHRVADLLDGAWRLLSRRAPTVVVGSELAQRYRHARRLLNTPISIVAAADVIEPDAALERRYDGELRVLAVGRVDTEKNPLLLADVLVRLVADSPRWKLVVCGDGPLLPALRAKLESLGIAQHAELRGFVSGRKQLRDEYRAAHMLLHVSWTEGVPQVLFEAFAAGLPVVATDVGGVAEATGAEAALLVPRGDPDAAAAALRRIAADPPCRAALMREALATASANTMEAAAARVARFIADE